MTNAAPSLKISKHAIASSVFGVLGLTCILLFIGNALGSLGLTLVLMHAILSASSPILALIFGIVAFRRIGMSDGRITGRGLAATGVALSVLCFLAVGMLFLWAKRAKNRAPTAQCVSNVHQIGLAVSMYADVHNGTIPRAFSDLRLYLPNLDKVLICPAARDTNRYSYEFVGVTNKWNESPNLIVLQEIEPRHRGWRTVLFDDGHVEQVQAAR